MVIICLEFGTPPRVRLDVLTDRNVLMPNDVMFFPSDCQKDAEFSYDIEYLNNCWMDYHDILGSNTINPLTLLIISSKHRDPVFEIFSSS